MHQITLALIYAGGLALIFTTPFLLYFWISKSQSAFSFFIKAISNISFALFLLGAILAFIATEYIWAISKHGVASFSKNESLFGYWFFLSLYCLAAALSLWRGIGCLISAKSTPTSVGAQTGIGIFASVPHTPISKPVAFLGLLFVGFIWGGLASWLLGSQLLGACALVLAAALIAAWVRFILHRTFSLSYLTFASVSLLCGFALIPLLAAYHA